MHLHEITLTTLITNGKAKAKITGDILDILTEYSIMPIHFNLYGDSFKRHYVSLPENYCLPFRLDMTVKLDYPMFLLFIGDGYLSFASSWQNNRKIDDIAFPTGKPNLFHSNFYDDHIPLNEWVDIVVTYNLDEMQILINGEERFYSRKFAYMKKRNRQELENLGLDGFRIAFAVSKLSTLSLKSITITEYEEAAPLERGTFNENQKLPAIPEERPKPTFESVIARLPQEFQEEIIATNHFLKSLHPLKFKRVIDKNGGKISWIASDYGISYHVEPGTHHLTHRFGWYLITSGKPETWHQKADHMEDTLGYISQFDPQLACRIFYALNDCVSCHGECCLAKKLYEFQGQKSLSCHSTVMLRMSHDDFNDAREFFRYLNEWISSNKGVPKT